MNKFDADPLPAGSPQTTRSSGGNKSVEPPGGSEQNQPGLTTGAGSGSHQLQLHRDLSVLKTGRVRTLHRTRSVTRSRLTGPDLRDGSCSDSGR